jgi:general secretion pathway protein E
MNIHLEPRPKQGVIRFRIDAVLHPVRQVPMGVLGAMTACMKTRRSHPAGGPGSAEEVEMRLSTLPTAFGETHDDLRWEALLSRPMALCW